MDKNWEARIVESAKELIDDLYSDAECAVRNGAYGSPIERAFAIACEMLLRTRYREFLFVPEQFSSVDLVDEQIIDGVHQRSIWGIVTPQAMVQEKRVDFLIRYISGLSSVSGVIVECDGHQFHEKTKEQAANDKRRDRDFVAAGYRVLRFSGSEIWNDPMRCASDAIEVAHSRAIDAAALRHAHKTGDHAMLAFHLKYAV